MKVYIVFKSDWYLIKVNLEVLAMWAVVYRTAVIKVEYDILWTLNRDPIPCPLRQTMKWLLRVLTKKSDHVMMELDCIMYGAVVTLAPTQCKDGLSRYGDICYKDKTVMRLSYLNHGNLYIDKKETRLRLRYMSVQSTWYMKRLLQSKRITGLVRETVNRGKK